MSIYDNYQIMAVVCYFWGDSGKGKIVDVFAENADVIVRGTGGANAGHTIHNRGKHILHLIPSGILHDASGKTNVIGRGVAFDARVAIEELDILKGHGIDARNLKIAYDAPLVLPQHLLLDRYTDSTEKVGTTQRGIGPCYADHISRVGLIANDLANPALFRKKLEANYENHKAELQAMNRTAAKKILSHEHLLHGHFYDEDTLVSLDKIVALYTNQYNQRLAPFVADATALIQEQKRKGAKILLEGAQGTLLSIDYGTTKFQTSSDCSVEGLAKGAGLKEADIDHVIGIVKAITTRVGYGPFPTELGGRTSEEYCNKGHTRDEEASHYGQRIEELIHSPDEFHRGIGLRMRADEYGATTGRTRRVGWLDLVALKYAMDINGHDLTLTKLDVLTGFPTIKICTGYTYMGDDMTYKGKPLQRGDAITAFPRQSEILYDCKPTYIEVPGWQDDITTCTTYASLPPQAKELLRIVEEKTGGRFEIVSVGPTREATIFLS